MDTKIKQWLDALTLEEKASICSGFDLWQTEPVERLDIPQVMMTDGPHGLRKMVLDPETGQFSGAVPATCFPSGVGLASTWNRDLMETVGRTIAQEALAENVSVVLGPGANIKRSPLCGRNFEYFSEDPLVSSQMAKHHILGVQGEGVGASLKHFVANNQEYMRMCVDTLVDERTLREIYYASFEAAVKEAQPWTIMCAYNQLNGEFCADSKDLLTGVLRDQWGFKGLVVSDWGAEDDRVLGIQAGLDLEMPGNNGRNDQYIIDSVNIGRLSMGDLDAVVGRVLTLAVNGVAGLKDVEVDLDAHHQVARKVAQESMVLLKNDNQVLPLGKEDRVLVVGELATRPRFQGGGSSHIHPTQVDIPLEAMEALGSVTFAQGYELDGDEVNKGLHGEALSQAQNADTVVVFAGLPDRYESEGYDRTHLRIPGNQQALIEALGQAHDRVVVVLSNGAPIEMPWLGQVAGVLEGYLGGQAGGSAVADLLYGHVSPSGKLAETFPVRLQDTPCYINFPGKGGVVAYQEGVFVGYRYYEAKDMDVLFPFGHGLSYTTFAYGPLKLSADAIEDIDILQVQVDVTNTGDRPGQEVVQLYVEERKTAVLRPMKELKAFDKIALEPGETKTVTLALDKRAFAYYKLDIGDWYVNSGTFALHVGSSSQDIRQVAEVNVASTVDIPMVYHRNSTLETVAKHPVGQEMVKQMVDKMAQLFSGLGDMGMEDMELHFMTSPIRNLVSFGVMDDVALNDLIGRLNGEAL